MSTPYEQAREHYSDEEIQTWMAGQPGGKEALEAGYSPEEFINHLAQERVASAPAQIGGEGPLGEALRVPLIGASAGVKGLAEAAGLPGDVEALALRGAEGLGLPHGVTEILQHGTFPTSGELVDATGRLGLTDRSDLISGWGSPGGAQSERLIEGAGQGLGQAAPLALLGPEGAAIPTLLSGAGGGLAQSAAEQAGAGEAGQVLAGAVGGGLSGGLAAAGRRAANSAAGRLGSAGSQFSEAGLPMRSPGLTSDNPATVRALSPHAPLAQTNQDISDVLQTVAAREGLPKPTSGGDLVGSLAQRWANKGRAQDELNNWRGLDAAMPMGTRTGLGNYERALQLGISRGGGLAGSVSALRSQMPEKLARMLNLDKLSRGTFSWKEGRTLQDFLRAKIESAPTQGKILQPLLDGLEKDLQLEAVGAKRGDLWSRAIGGQKAISRDAGLISRYARGQGDIASTWNTIPPTLRGRLAPGTLGRQLDALAGVQAKVNGVKPPSGKGFSLAGALEGLGLEGFLGGGGHDLNSMIHHIVSAPAIPTLAAVAAGSVLPRAQRAAAQLLGGGGPISRAAAHYAASLPPGWVLGQAPGALGGAAGPLTPWVVGGGVGEGNAALPGRGR